MSREQKITSEPDAAPDATRQGWMGILAQAPAAMLVDRAGAYAAEAGALPGFAWLRPPEIGTVMVRGRTGGTGRAFNLGEVTVTRCALRLDDGAGIVGHALVQGRDKDHARLAALFDALMQGPDAARVRVLVLDPIRAALDHRRRLRAEKAAATKVEFFTMVRGED